MSFKFRHEFQLFQHISTDANYLEDQTNEAVIVKKEDNAIKGGICFQISNILVFFSVSF